MAGKRIALLIGANPQRSKGGPVVRLPAGMWAIEIENVKNSILHLYLDGNLVGVWNPEEHLFVMSGAEVQLLFLSRGSEPYISAFARKVA